MQEVIGFQSWETLTAKMDISALFHEETSKIPDLDKRVALAKEIGTETGFCWASALPQCVAQIVSNAKIAARKMPR
jgi:hypothetical protein